MQKELDRLGAHPGHFLVELPGELLLELPVPLVGQQLTLLEREPERVDLLFVGDDDVALEVEHLLQFPQGDVEQVADPRGQALEEPDVGAGAGQLDVTEPFPAHLRLGHLDTALVADDPAVLHPLVLAAEALPVGDRAEDPGAEEPVPLRFEGPVVDRLGFGNVPVRPRTDLVRRGQTDPDCLEVRGQRLLASKSIHDNPPSVRPNVRRLVRPSAKERPRRLG